MSKLKLNTYTIFALYEDNRQKYSEVVKEETPELAIKRMRKHMRQNTGQELLVAAVVEGEVKSVDIKAYGYE